MGTVNVVLGEDTRLNLILGQQLENAVTEVVFDFSAWQTTYGSGTLALSVQRPGDEMPYAVVLTTSGTDATWSVTNLDTAYKGVGHIQLTYTVGSAIKKSVVYKFTVYESLGANGEYPSPGQTWQEGIEDDIEGLRTDVDADHDELIDIREGADGVTYPSAGDAVRGQITGLKADLSDLETDLNNNMENIVGLYVIPFSDPTKRQYIVTNGTTVQWDTPSVSSSTNIKWAVVECAEGDKFTLNGSGGNSDRFWAFADSSKNIISKAGVGASGTNLHITAPENAKYLIINNEQDKLCYVGYYTEPLDAKVTQNATDIASINTQINQIVGWENATFADGFSMEKLASGIKVSWNRLYVKRKYSYTDINTPKEYILTDSQPILFLNSSGSIVQAGSISVATRSDIVLLLYRDGKIVSGVLYPYYVNNLYKFHFDDNAHLNVYKQAQQLAQLKWTPKGTVKAGEGTHPAGTEVVGIPYASVKEYLKYVGIDVSLHTFMTAVNDEHSLLYTECPDEYESRSDYGITYHGVNCYSYYGSVCSGFVTTALGSKIQYNSWEYQTFPNKFKVLDNQDVRNLLVGDVLSYNGHCAVIANIERNPDGSIKYFELDEHSAPIHIGDNMRPNYLTDRVKSVDGKWCRYYDIEDNTNYKPSPFVLIGDDYLYYTDDFVYVDGVSSRTFYRCKFNNSDSTFKSSNWTQINGFVPNQVYSSFPTSFVSVGEKLYRCIKGGTLASFSLDNWEEVKGVVEWASYPYTYNDDIVTFAGDRACFHSDDLIYINYVKGSYTSMQLYKDGVLIQTITLPSSGYQINVSSYCSDGGMYKARLTDGTNYSRYTYFEVVDTQVSATYENGYATVEFSSVNGTPIEVQIVEQSGATVCHMELSEAEIANGRIIINPLAKMFAEKYVYPNRYVGYSANIYARVMFAGEYGNVVNEMILLGAFTASAGLLVNPNESKNFGVVDGANKVMLESRVDDNNYTFSFVAGANTSVTVIPSAGLIKWNTELPQTLVEDTQYLVSIQNGIGDVVGVL